VNNETIVSDRRRVVITGLGVVNAAGTGVEAFWKTIEAARPAISAISRFDASGFPVHVAGEVRDFDPSAEVPRRFLAKTDRFTQFALVAVQEALADASLNLEEEDRSRVGVWFGNNTGGWDLCERGFAEYYVSGADVVNPWQATAWFLAAPQGFVTIRHGLQGPSKSFSGDRASGAVAFYYGTRALEWGRNDVVLAGGCEAPISPLALLCFHASGDLTSRSDPEGAYRPFDCSADGLVVGEGGVALVLEEAEHARRRGAPVLLEVLGGAHGTAPGGDPECYANLILRALEDAECGPADIDLVLCEGCGTRNGDRFELEALSRAFGRDRRVPVSVPKSMYGHLYGASFGTDVVTAATAARVGVAPATVGFEHGHLADGLDLVRIPRDMRIERFLVTSHSRYGSCVAMVFQRPQSSVV
jgi:3-oxoacyl-(acyl-carrier-protein) synthase